MSLELFLYGAALLLLASEKKRSKNATPKALVDEPTNSFSDGDPFRGTATDLVQVMTLTLTCKGCEEVVQEVTMPIDTDAMTMLRYFDSSFIPVWEKHVKHKHFLRFLFIRHPKFAYNLVREWRKKDGHARLS